MGLYLGQNLQTDWPLSCLFLLCDRLVDQSTLRKSVKNVSAWNTFFFPSQILSYIHLYFTAQSYTPRRRGTHLKSFSDHQPSFLHFSNFWLISCFTLFINYLLLTLSATWHWEGLSSSFLFFFSVRKTAARCLWKQGRLEPQAWTSCDPKSKITRC